MGWLHRILGRKQEVFDYPPLNDFTSIGTDIHSHLIPGIDDGVQTMEDSLQLLRELQDLGFKKIVTTPHIMSDYFRNTPEIILDGLAKVRAAAQQEGITLELHAAAEYYLDEAFAQMVNRNEKLLTIADKYLLFEISYVNPPDNIQNIVFDLNIQGYVPVLAHPERYPFWYGKTEIYTKLKDLGVQFQLNTNSIVGYYGPAARHCAEWLINQDMIDFIGSDMHGVRHLEALKKVPNEKYFWKLAARGVKNSLL